MPVQLKGVGGPGAPHVFNFTRRCDVPGVAVANTYWPEFEADHHDVVLRTVLQQQSLGVVLGVDGCVNMKMGM